MIRRREFEQSEAWALVKDAINRRVAMLTSSLLQDDVGSLLYRAQGGIMELVSLRDDLPRSLPDEIKNGRPEIDPVREILKDK